MNHVNNWAIFMSCKFRLFSELQNYKNTNFGFHFSSPNRDQYCLAYPYYLMSHRTIEQVFSRIAALTQHIPNDSQHMKGAVHTLKVMIIKSTDSNEEMGRKLSSTHDSNHTFGEKLLDFLAKYAPNEIAVLGLTSPIFRELMSTKMCDVILQMKKDNQL